VQKVVLNADHLSGSRRMATASRYAQNAHEAEGMIADQCLNRSMLRPLLPSLSSWLARLQSQNQTHETHAHGAAYPCNYLRDSSWFRQQSRLLTLCTTRRWLSIAEHHLFSLGLSFYSQPGPQLSSPPLPPGLDTRSPTRSIMHIDVSPSS
jgi:hypothetical protein